MIDTAPPSEACLYSHINLSLTQFGNNLPLACPSLQLL